MTSFVGWTDCTSSQIGHKSSIQTSTEHIFYLLLCH